MVLESKPTILCIDDEQDVLDSLTDVFMDEYNVRTTLSGKEALEIIGSEEICVVITDQRMPDMEGTEVLERITALGSKSKKVLLTGYSDINAAIDAINKGSVDKYFSKPWDNDVLFTEIGKLAKDYSTDLFLDKILQEGIAMKSTSSKSKLFEEFLESYPYGICLIKSGEIEYLNRKARGILNDEDMKSSLKKPYEDIFLLSASDKAWFEEKYRRNDFSPYKMEVKTSDGTSSTVQGILTFLAPDGSPSELKGIVFW